jgi:hypothetical protein
MNRTSRRTQALPGGVIILLIVLFVAVGVRLEFSNAQGNDAKAKRWANLRAVALAYFDGLAKHDLSKFPYDDQISLRAPLNPKGGVYSPIVGKTNVLNYFAGILALVKSTTVQDTFVNEALTRVCAEALIDVASPVVETTLRVNACFTVNDGGRVTEQENHFDPRAVTHPQRYLDFPKQYFEALASSDENTLQNLILGNLADTFRGRAPLTPSGTSEEELVGPQAWVNYLLPFLPVIKSQRLLWAAVDGDMVCGKAYLGIAQGSNDADTPYKRLRLIDCWKFDPTTGKITEQENHYDPRPVLPQCTSCGGTATSGCVCP